jgi:hypothetical protein
MILQVGDLVGARWEEDGDALEVQDDGRTSYIVTGVNVENRTVDLTLNPPERDCGYNNISVSILVKLKSVLAPGNAFFD